MHDRCTASASNHIKNTDDTAVVGLIQDNNLSDREEVKQLVAWCCENSLVLNMEKTTELSDFRRKEWRAQPLATNRQRQR